MIYNKVLTDVERDQLCPAMAVMRQNCPEMYARKIAQSMVQFAYAYQTTVDLMPKLFDRSPFVLSAGSHEDIATEAMKHENIAVVGIDPVLNCDLHTFRLRTYEKFDAVVSASVLEHTENDEEFLADSCDLLLPGGIGVFTMDFKNDWTPGQRLPTTSNRFYTAADLTERLPRVLAERNCALVGTSDYSAIDHFQWEGINYSFATFIFRKADERHNAQDNGNAHR
jgi:SAM-dependent methyltransferase